jgi:hypothetical protein
MENFIQRRKVGVAGSFINQMMGNNKTLPEVGKGATIMHYSDRDAAEVIEVSADFKTVKLESLTARYDNAVHKNGHAPMGHQDWILEPTGHFFTVVWKWGGWKVESNVVRFTKAFNEQCEKTGYRLTDEQRKAIFNEDGTKNVVEGMTERAKEYSKISILFGCKDYHYDWEF